MDENNISVEEVMKITHKSREFIINAIQHLVPEETYTFQEKHLRTI